MTTRPRPAYFPVLPAEQALLERIRRADLQRIGLTDVLTMLDLLAEAGVGPAELERALELHRTHEHEDGLDARFENLEARLRGDIERRVAEMEGRLSKRLGETERAEAPARPRPAASREGTPNSTGPTKNAEPARNAASTEPVANETGDDVLPDSVVAFRIGEHVIEGASVADFYRSVWMWLVDDGHVTARDLPIRSGKKRFVAAAEPVHASGSEFIKSFEYRGVFVEMNQSRQSAVRAAGKVLTSVGVPYEILVGGERPASDASSRDAGDLRAAF